MEVSLLTIVGIIGNIISVLLFLSPTSTFLQIIKLKSVGLFSEIPYICSLANCLIWVFYGLPLVTKNNILVVTINGFGTAMEAIYVLIFIIFSKGKQRIQVVCSIIIELILYAALVAVMLIFFPIEKRSLVVGILAVCFNIGMYASPLCAMKTVVQTKSVDSMPLPLTVCSLVNSATWSIYSLIKRDLFILIPNGVGVMFSIAQLALYCFYFSKQNCCDEAVGSTTVKHNGNHALPEQIDNV